MKDAGRYGMPSTFIKPILTPGSLLAIRPRWLGTAESIPASDLTNAPTRIARRHSLDGPH